MKKLIVLILLFPNIFFSQEEFSFELYFEDALGNKDTLVLGYDPLATDSIDVAFGEVNIINQPWDSVFEVRCSDKMQFQETPSFQTKKNIRTFGDRISIEVISINFPITLSWDATLFNNNQLMGSQFQLPKIVDFSHYFYSSSNYELWENDLSDGSIDSLNTGLIYVWIQDSSVIGLNTNKLEKTELSIFPNPSNSQVFVSVKNEYIKEIVVFNLQGKIIHKLKVENIGKIEVDVSDWSKGIYLFKVMTENDIKTKKVIIQ